MQYSLEGIFQVDEIYENYDITGLAKSAFPGVEWSSVSVVSNLDTFYILATITTEKTLSELSVLQKTPGARWKKLRLLDKNGEGILYTHKAECTVDDVLSIAKEEGTVLTRQQAIAILREACAEIDEDDILFVPKN